MTQLYALPALFIGITINAVFANSRDGEKPPSDYRGDILIAKLEGAGV